MTYPGLQDDQKWTPPAGWAMQSRQSHAGAYPGYADYTTVIDSMGSYAPGSAVAAEHVTVTSEAAADPFTIEADNFEARGAQFGVNQNTPNVFQNNADSGFVGQATGGRTDNPDSTPGVGVPWAPNPTAG